MIKMFSAIFFSLILFTFSLNFTLATSWYFPMENAAKRATIKPFGQYLNEKFYQGKDKLFPGERYLGEFHAGVDLEINPYEINQLTPFYAVSDGKIIFTGTIEGYGGVLLLQINNQPHTALYGHIKLNNLKIKINQQVKAGQLLGFLGNSFSDETAKERKHLHFGIYKSQEPYFRGHENSQEELNSNWENPLVFLKNRKALFPKITEAKLKTAKTTTNNNFFVALWNKITNLFKLI